MSFMSSVHKWHGMPRQAKRIDQELFLSRLDTQTLGNREQRES